MPIKIIVRGKPAEVITPPSATVAPPEVKKPASEPDKPTGDAIPRCRYCGHSYLSGGCNFERQKKCANHPPGKARVVATKSLD